MKLLFYLVSISVLVSSCIPIPVPLGSYYKPSYPVDSVKEIGESCHGYTGPMTGIEFEIDDGIIIEVKTPSTTELETKNPLVVRYKIPKGVNISFLSNRIKITKTDNYNVKLPIETITLSSSYQKNIDEFFKIDNIFPNLFEEFTFKNKDDSYWIDYSVVNYFTFENDPEFLELSLPNIKTKNHIINFDHILLQKRGHLYATNEIYNQQKIKYEECKKKSKFNRCEYILEYLPLSFQVEQDGVNIEGRVGRWGESVNVFIDKMFINSSEEWRFDNKTIKLTDIEKNRDKSRRPSIINIHSGRHVIPFVDSVITPKNVTYGYMTIEYKLSLGDEKQHQLEIELPSMKINDRDFHFKKLKIEKKTFDWEFPPFNC